MTDTRRGGTRVAARAVEGLRAVAATAALTAALAACRGTRTPAPPAPAGARAPAPELLDTFRADGPPALQPYLDAYPLGELGSRMDLVACDSQRSMHFVQMRRGTPRCSRPARTQTVYVLTGTGTCYLGDRSYPIRPGSAYRIAPGVAYSALPDAGAPIVAVCYLEPPLTEGDDTVPAE